MTGIVAWLVLLSGPVLLGLLAARWAGTRDERRYGGAGAVVIAVPFWLLLIDRAVPLFGPDADGGDLLAPLSQLGFIVVGVGAYTGGLAWIRRGEGGA